MPMIGRLERSTSSFASAMHLRGDGRAGRAGEVDLDPVQDVAVEVEDRAAEDRVVAEVDADDLVAGAVDVEESRGLAGAGALAGADLDDEVVDDELGDEVGDGDPGEPGLAGEIGAAPGTEAVEGLKDERAVVRPGVLRKHLDARAQRATGGEAVRAVREAGPGGGVASRVEELRCASGAVMFVSKAYEQSLRKLCMEAFTYS